MQTIAAPITPLIRSAIILVRVSGAEAVKILKFLRHTDSSPHSLPDHGKVYHAMFDNGDVRDDVLFYYFKSPKSYTGEDVIEISFHGNPLIVKSALASFLKEGIRYAEPGEFTKRAFLNGKMDLSQAEAVEEMISAKSEAGLFYTYNQLRGGLRRDVEILKDLYIDALTLVEAYIDFPEEDLSEKAITHAGDLYAQIGANLRSVIQGYNALKSVNDTVVLSIIGRPNVGKSSVMNYMLKENRAIVSDTPGTTRDYIDAEMVVGSHPVQLVDTAGIRRTDDCVEQAGIERSLERARGSHIVILLLDLSDELYEDDLELLKSTADRKRIIVGNKLDKKAYEHSTDINISVKTGENFHEFTNLLDEAVSSEDPEIYEHAVAVNERQKNGFVKMLNTLENAQSLGFEDLDALAFELRDSLNVLSEITGETYTEDILANIFSSFCIGK
jgi:tRNA modification GTPase